MKTNTLASFCHFSWMSAHQHKQNGPDTETVHFRKPISHCEKFDMITNIKLLQNIGKFDSCSAGALLDLKKLTLFYAANAQGKTTLSAVFRSLANDDPMPITERHRLGASHLPKVVLNQQDNPPVVIFQNGEWNTRLANLKVFDDNFVDSNVHSGLVVESHHRQNLHELILGDQGVALNRKLQELVSRVTKHNDALTVKSTAIPEQERFGLSVDDFCKLPRLPNLDEQITTTERALKATRDQTSVQNQPDFATIDLPNFATKEIQDILEKDLPDLDKSAEIQVQEHLQELGDNGESWVASGMNKVKQRGNNTCPFCSQDMGTIDLIAHYRAYFSDAYTRLKHTIFELLNDIDHEHTDGQQAEFERSVSTLKQSQQFWSSYCEVPTIDIDTRAIVDDWSTAKNAVSQQLKMKQSAPLEPQTLSQSTLDALNNYDVKRQAIIAMNETLLQTNKAIQQVKQQADLADTDQIEGELNELRATQFRFREDIDSLCNDYLEELKAKANTEKDRDAARSELEEYRNNVFPQLQMGVNSYLDRFNAGFRVGDLKSMNIGRGTGSTCTYNVVINDTPIAVSKSSKSLSEPSFRSSLSAGDRNTLALALFFSSLDQSPNLADIVMVVDDPMSSLDDHRSLVTVQAVREMMLRVKQTIVLSHNKRFLCSILSDGKNLDISTTLEIAPNGNESTIRHWNASKDSITEHDQRYFLLQNYFNYHSGPKREVASAIRLYLEGYFRVVCPGQFPPGTLLGHFINKCWQRVNCKDEIMDEQTLLTLDNVREYANRFHHDTNSAWETELIDPTELWGFVKQTLSLTGSSAN